MTALRSSLAPHAASMRELAAQRRAMDWMFGDLLVACRSAFPADKMSAMLAELPDDLRSLRRAERVARAFPPKARVASLSFEHHAKVADLPAKEAAALLKRAEKRRLTPGQLRGEAMLRKIELGLVMLREDDPEDDAMLALARRWNRAPRSVREDFAEMVSSSHLGVIEP